RYAELRCGPRAREYRWLARLARLRGRLQPARLQPGRTVVVADFHPTADMLRDRLREMPAALAAPFPPDHPIPGIHYSLLRTDTNPLELSEEVARDIPGRIDAIATFLPWERVTGQTLKRWWRLGVKRCWFLRESVVVGIRPFWAMAFRGYSNMLRRGWARVRLRDGPVNIAEESCRRFLDTVGVA